MRNPIYVNPTILANVDNLGYSNIIGRATGRSTAIILQCIAESIRTPGCAIKLYDHQWDRAAVASPKHVTWLAQQVRDTITQLGLEQIAVKREAGYVTITNNFIKELS